MMMTRRDLDIISFLEDYRIASTTTLKQLFFPSLMTCQARIKKLYDNGNIKRARMTMNYDYLYYVKKPSKVTHDLLVTEFYGKLLNNSEVLQYKIDKELGNIRPDSIFAYKIKEEVNIGLLEVEISHKGFDYEKYEKFYKSGEYIKWFKVMPTVYVVCKNAKIPTDTKINFICIKTDMNDFRLEGLI